jgi:hypothetical protein
MVSIQDADQARRRKQRTLHSAGRPQPARDWADASTVLPVVLPVVPVLVLVLVLVLVIQYHWY